MPTITLTKPFERHPSSVQNKTEAGLRWRVLIVDPHSSIREMIRMILDGYADLIEVAGEAADAEEAVEQAKAMAVDLVLMDAHLANGVEATRRTCARATRLRCRRCCGPRRPPASHRVDRCGRRPRRRRACRSRG